MSTVAESERYVERLNWTAHTSSTDSSSRLKGQCNQTLTPLPEHVYSLFTSWSVMIPPHSASVDYTSHLSAAELGFAWGSEIDTVGLSVKHVK